MTEYTLSEPAKRINTHGETEILYRFIFPVSEQKSFISVLEGITDGFKIQLIDPGEWTHVYDLFLTDGELLMMRMAVSGLMFKAMPPRQ